LIGFVALLIGVFDGLLEAPLFSHLRLPEIADGTMPAHVAASGRRWTLAFVLSAFIPALTYYPHSRWPALCKNRPPSCPRALPTRSWSGHHQCADRRGQLMPFAPKPARRAGIIGRRS